MPRSAAVSRRHTSSAFQVLALFLAVECHLISGTAGAQTVIDAKDCKHLRLTCMCGTVGGACLLGRCVRSIPQQPLAPPCWVKECNVAVAWWPHTSVSRSCLQAPGQQQ
jgi:hypothetical protein